MLTDHVFGPETQTREIFDVLGKPIVEGVINGVNGILKTFEIVTLNIHFAQEQSLRTDRLTVEKLTQWLVKKWLMELFHCRSCICLIAQR